MYRQIEDFINDWKYESESTLKMFSNLTDESLTKKVNENVRTAGKLAWHITGAISELGHRMGLTFEKVDQDSPIPSTAKEIVDEYKHASDVLINEIKEKWNDDTLSVEDVVAGHGVIWSREKTLGALISHQIHHRAQLTVIMRLNGLKVPGVYGPSKEEWTSYGMPVQE
jgi:uncharacterized damage-inducible protein DinB